MGIDEASDQYEREEAFDCKGNAHCSSRNLGAIAYGKDLWMDLKYGEESGKLLSTRGIITFMDSINVHLNDYKSPSYTFYFWIVVLKLKNPRDS